MEQVIFGGHYGLLADTVVMYNSLSGGKAWILISGGRRQLISTDGVIKNFRAKLSGAPGGGKKYTFTLILNGNPTALTFDIADAATTGGNIVNEVTVTGGDYVFLQATPTGTPTAVYATWTSVFKGDNANESLILGGTEYPLSTTTTKYGQVMCAFTWLTDVEDDHRQVVPTAGTIKNLYVKLLVDPGTAPEAYRFTVRLNGTTVAQSLIVTITADATTGSDLVHNLVVVAGDILTLMVEPLNSPSVGQWNNAWGMTFVADINGESIVMGGSTDNLDNAAAEYNYLTGGDQTFYTWHGNEAIRYQLGQACTLKKLHVLLSTAPGAGNDRDFALRIAGTNVVTLQISDAATTGDSGALSDTVALDEYVGLRTIPTDTPDAADAYWGFVCYIPPPCPLAACLYVNAYAVGAGARDGWTKVGATPYIDVMSFPINYIWTDADVDQTGDFSFADMPKGEPTTVEVALYCRREVGAETITVNIWDGGGWNNVGNIVPDATWAWKTIDISAILNTKTKVSAAKMWLQHNV